MNEEPKIVKSKADIWGSAHLLIEPVGPLSAGNDFNWWNLVIVEPGKTVAYARQGCYGVYAAHGQGSVTYIGASTRHDQPISAANEWDAPESKEPGYFTLEITNTGTVPLVAFVLLAVDPGTTPIKKKP